MMSEPSHDRFYADLPVFDRFERFADPEVYREVPASWSVLVLDVEGSTKAIAAGRYKEVNSLGVAGIVSVSNALRGVEFPYCFGGDGATMLVPASAAEAARAAAGQAVALGRDVFGLGMRAGMVPVEVLRSANAPVRVARFRLSDSATLAMLDGGGIPLAETWVKEPGSRYGIAAAAAADAACFEGFQCRWSPIPSRRGRVVSLLVSLEEAPGAGCYADVVTGIERAVGRSLEELCPLEEDRLRLARGWRALESDARVATGRGSGVRHVLHRITTWVGLRLGSLLFRTGWKLGGFDGSAYRREVVTHTDYRKYDAVLRMILDLTPEEVAALRGFLEEGRHAGRWIHGLHESDAALMTCFVRDFGGGHLHFLDGADGGYALAALEMKRRQRSARDG